MIHYGWLFVAASVGAVVGFFVMALLAMAGGGREG